MRQILINLISNAIKFTSEGKVSVEVGVSDGKESSDATEMVISVGIKESVYQQTGCIVYSSPSPKSIIRKITREYTGTELGLSICKQLTELINGRIWLEEPSGQGACFTFTIPLIDVQETILT
ncbi:ATP-binding protein [Paenibacillus solani]|uniref:ATP-binding protein n=1 Tax=Paenibacillus solani TaxID=1705565 RepID=UPI003D28E155